MVWRHALLLNLTLALLIATIYDTIKSNDMENTASRYLTLCFIASKLTQNVKKIVIRFNAIVLITPCMIGMSCYMG